ncbi:MAG: endonuclease domain-containing protein [Shimia sp.]
MTARARNLRANATDAEKTLWAALRRDQLGLRFRRQVVFDQRFILDFYAPSVRLAVEADGSQHVDCAKDRDRTAYLAARGVTVLRFWNSEILAETDAVLMRIGEVISLLRGSSAFPLPPAASPLTPLPGGGGDPVTTSADARAVSCGGDRLIDHPARLTFARPAP